MKEEELIRLSCQGDQKAMESLYLYYVPKMRSLCFRYTQSVFEVDDILQDAFVKVFSKISTFKYNGSFEGWVRRIVVNTAINYYNSSINFRNQVSIDIVNDGELESVEIAESASMEDLYDAVNKLPSGYRFVFNMYAIDGYSHKEISEILNISESTSRSQYTRARKQLINSLQELNYARI